MKVDEILKSFEKISLVNKYSRNYPVNLIFGNCLNLDVQLIILQYLDNNQKFELLINTFLISSSKFNIFFNNDNNNDLFIYWTYLIKSKDLFKSYNRGFQSLKKSDVHRF